MAKTLDIPKFGGYHRRLQLDEDAELTHVGPGTPGGEYLRRFWHPIALASELGDAPVPIQILGEALVIFRDKRGQVGLLHRHCSHRGTSLEFGIVSERGIRCCYHGWLYDVDGTVLETPSEPPSSTLKSTLCHGAYRTREYGGLVFAYMGPPEETPPFPLYDCWESWPQPNRLVPYKIHTPCNWLQAHENGADPIHTAYLHAIVSGVQFSPSFSALPQLEFLETPIGLLAIATRRSEDNLWIRASDVILPNAAQFGTGFVDAAREKFAVCAWLSRWIVPIDDRNSYAIGLRHFNKVIDPRDEGREEAIGLGKVDFMGQTAERPYAERQKSPGDYDALVGQRSIALHANEHLASSDRGVATVRRQIRRGIRALQEGKPLPAPKRYPSGVVPTYNAEIVLRVPPNGGDDTKLIQAFGRKTCEIVIATADLPPGERHREIERRVREMVGNELTAQAVKA
ncbi:MAG TPA: aromatic ring-hydroxylating dioxygenase subunit alpha [Burkholderiales bacterium]|jgi:nitrite reductase/ring-hydroxylating ferredoxin subunit|nr:aromatic ring-hydroxylating dioxygenase subunit alpha [Burkholderiales bacterium]